jgi:hypothetical protein
VEDDPGHQGPHRRRPGRSVDTPVRILPRWSGSTRLRRRPQSTHPESLSGPDSSRSRHSCCRSRCSPP